MQEASTRSRKVTTFDYAIQLLPVTCLNKPNCFGTNTVAEHNVGVCVCGVGVRGGGNNPEQKSHNSFRAGTEWKRQLKQAQTHLSYFVQVTELKNNHAIQSILFGRLFCSVTKSCSTCAQPHWGGRKGLKLSIHLIFRKESCTACSFCLVGEKGVKNIISHAELRRWARDLTAGEGQTSRPPSWAGKQK